MHVEDPFSQIWSLKSNKYIYNSKITIPLHPLYNQGLLYIKINFYLLYLPDCMLY